MNTRFFSFFTLLALGFGSACRATSHPTQPSPMGQAVSSQVMEAVLKTPGPVELTTVVSADWEIDRAGLINLEHEHAVSAGLEDGPEPIQIYFHLLRHPTRGDFIVDTGVETKQRTDPKRALFRGLLGRVMNVDKLKVHHGLGEWLAQHHVKLAGVFLTHLHLDHVSGMRDVQRGTPIYIGPGEAEARSFQNLFASGVLNEALKGHAVIESWGFSPDADGRFAGILDVFGDASVFALHVPGHTAGSTAYLVRSTKGPVLLVGDASHTDWGWSHGVEPGTFSSDLENSRESLERLRALVTRHPEIDVRLGHQARSGSGWQPAESRLSSAP